MINILKISNLSKVYYDQEKSIQALKDFTYTFEKGKFYALVGPSGCGKSTLLSILSGLEDKTDGVIESDDKQTIGYMLQNDCLFPWMTIKDNCLLGLKVMKTVSAENIKFVEGLLEKYGLGTFMNEYPTSLSGGMRQRVALIRTLATNPDIILLDEPFSALDYQTRLHVSNDVYQIIKEEGKTALMVTHDLTEAIALSDTVIVLSKRPGMLKREIMIDLGEDRNPLAVRGTKEFGEYYDLLWKEIDVNE